MKARKLFYKDLSGLRFAGLIGIFVYVITFIFATQEPSKVSNEYLSVAVSIKNISINIFFVLSSFLLTAHGLREYKYKSQFSIIKFYYRRFLRIFPVLFLALLFYFLVHPFMVEFLNLTPLSDENKVLSLIFYPEYYQSITSEVSIYLHFMYYVLVIIQFYILWGLILKFLKPYFIYIATLLIGIGILLKLFGDANLYISYFYLPYYFFEIGIGSLTAVIIRGESPLISKIKSLSSSTIGSIYISGIILSLCSYFLVDTAWFRLFSKLYLSVLAGFYILEQTYAKDSPLKLRNSLFLIQMGNLSYGFVILGPIVSITVLIALESTEIDINSTLITLIYPIICFVLTWFISYFIHQTIEQFFAQIRKEHRVL